MTDIERIRAEVKEVRKEHVHHEGEDVKIGPLCGALDCAAIWPCPTLRLAEDKLKLAEAVAETIGFLRSAGYDHACAKIERVLSEVSEGSR